MNLKFIYLSIIFALICPPLQYSSGFISGWVSGNDRGGKKEEVRFSLPPAMTRKKRSPSYTASHSFFFFWGDLVLIAVISFFKKLLCKK